MIYKLSSLAVVVGMAFALGATPALAQKSGEKLTKLLERECKTKIVSRTGGRSRIKLFARKKARDAWRQKMRKKYGRQWSSWLYSKDASYSCFKERGRNRCTVKAKPCKLPAVISGTGKVCSFYKISGTGKAGYSKWMLEKARQEYAEHKARKDWAARVREFYGAKMDTWLASNSKDSSCKKKKDGGFVCTVTSQPCHYRIFN